MKFETLYDLLSGISDVGKDRMGEITIYKLQIETLGGTNINLPLGVIELVVNDDAKTFTLKLDNTR